MLSLFLSPDDPLPNYSDWVNLPEGEQVLILAFGLERTMMAMVDISMSAHGRVWVRGVLSCLRVMVTLKRISTWSNIFATDGQSIVDLVDTSLLPWINSVVAHAVWRNSTTYGLRRLIHPEMVHPDTPEKEQGLYRAAWDLLIVWERLVDLRRRQWVPFSNHVGFLYSSDVRS